MASTLKRVLGQLPIAAAMYDAVRPIRPRTRYNLEQLRSHLPAAVEQARPYASASPAGRKILLFATLHYWIEQAAIVGLTLRGMGHDVTVGYLPYSSWQRDITAFDLQRQALYTRRVLTPMHGLVRSVSLLDIPGPSNLPDRLERAVETGSAYDVMYSLQSEEVDTHSDLYRLRMQRNRSCCRSALALLQAERPDVVLIPNGLVTELAIVYQVARQLGLLAITYEFNDQREQIWLAQNEIVMRQNTDRLWQARSGLPLRQEERAQLASLEQARSSGGVYGKGTRPWQDAAQEGSDHLREKLRLDRRPVVLLATNVLGDSLTLGRHLFAASMAEWIEKTVRYFVERRDVQFILRVHPGERMIKGPSMVGVIERAAPNRPEHVHVVGPSDPTNTYDLIGLADLGLAYTTTVGLEMAMRAIPVIVAGETHYRKRGFSLDPSTYEEYFGALDRVLVDPAAHRLTPAQVDSAWNYAYRFFFEYPFDFPWRLMHFWKDMDVWPVGRVLSQEGRAEFGPTFGYLAGEEVRW